MINKRLTFGRYEIVPIGLDLSCDKLYDFMILQQLCFQSEVNLLKYAGWLIEVEIPEL